VRSSAIIVLGLLTAGSVGCTTFSLQQRTLNQIETMSDYRLQMTLDCLATAADEPDKMPSFAILGDGLTRVQDMGSVSATTNWTRALGGFATQALGITVSRSPQGQWTIAPAGEYSQMQAIHCACLWVLDGPDTLSPDCIGILDSPATNPLPGPHFGVIERLRRLPCGWLHRGRLIDVPHDACHKAHHGDMWVWVMPDGLEGLTDFALTLLDIVTLDINNGATTSPPVLVTLQRWQSFPNFNLPTATWGYLDPDQPMLKQEGVEKVSRTTWELLKKAMIEREPFASYEDFDRARKALALPAADDKQVLKLQTKFLQMRQADKGSPYTAQVGFAQTRVINPGFVKELERRINLAARNDVTTSQSPSVNVTWEEWMANTTPYHGVRSNIKPGGAVAQPAPQPVLQRTITPLSPETGGYMMLIPYGVTPPSTQPKQ
jgi:hypothetical protein